jgi:hypothetical protein
MVGTQVLMRAAVGLPDMDRFGTSFEAVLRGFDNLFMESLLNG